MFGSVVPPNKLKSPPKPSPIALVNDRFCEATVSRPVFVLPFSFLVPLSYKTISLNLARSAPDRLSLKFLNFEGMVNPSNIVFSAFIPGSMALANTA